MSGSKHTPGPWTLEAKAGRVYVKASIDGRGKHVAYVIPIVDHDADMPFNADLIAAAPDMAEALIRFVSMAHIYSQFNLPSYADDIAKARAALAKAGL